ncbi:MAG TPA: class II glutamine amidotransferase [Thermoplasmata archaeon]|nr:class II glutamine amidotransferase [Thermoplasmata archaeon]
MCRLFGLLTAQPETGEPWLVRSDRSLLAQSNVPGETAQKDGWGIGWFDAPDRARIEKGVGGAFEPGERERFVRVAGEARSTLVIGHLRHASNPLGLPHEKLISLENSQPFGNHTTIFAHNGAIAFPNETRPYLGVHEKEVVGVNDSEVLFRLLLRHYEEMHDAFRAYAHAVDDLDRVWIDVGRPKVSPYSGLNVLFAPSPRELWAFCLSLGDHGCGLLDHSRPYYEMTYHAEPHRLVVGSEPFDAAPNYWKTLSSGTFLHATVQGMHVDVQTGAIPTPTLYTAKAPLA